MTASISCAFENQGHRVLVTDIRLIKVKVLATDLANPLQSDLAAVDQIVDDDQAMPRSQQSRQV
jgi:hypothetical protein